MARISFKKGDEYALKLSKFAAGADEVAKKAIHAGANIVADRMKAGIKSLPTEKFRYLRDGDKFRGVTESQKKDLEESFGITPIAKDKNGDLNAKLGFDDYGSFPTKKYPKGVPNQLLARAVESGSSVRYKTPFVRPAVNASKKPAVTEMACVIDEEAKKIFE